ncbi:MAG: endonuclease [Bacteroidota bacterium]
MKHILTVCAFIISHIFATAQTCDLRFQKDTLDFGTVRAGETLELTARIANTGTDNSQILSVKFTDPAFTAQVSPSILAPGEFRDIPIVFKTAQNLDYAQAAFVRISCGLNEYSIPLVLKAHVIYSDSVYNFTQNITGEALKIALKNYVSNHTSLTYKDARTAMFSYIDNVAGEVECVYTGRKITATGIPDINVTNFNTEHTWPQSKGADNEPPRSDLNHIFPTDELANAKRASFGFGYVSEADACWAVGGSKLQCSTKFEPRDVHKGNVARAMFYFSTRYGNPFNYMSEQNQEIPLREWMKLDPVDAREMKRNDEIEKLQKRRNPFIDHPEFVDRIVSFSGFDGGRGFLITSDDTVVIDVRNGPSQLPGYVFLKGGQEEERVDFQITTDRKDIFSIEMPDSSISPNGFIKIIFKATDFSSTNQIATLNVSGSKIYVLALQNATSVAEQNVFKTFTLQQNFPNPVEGATTIQFTAQPYNTVLKMYNMQGQEIFDATPLIQWQEASGSLTLQKGFLQQFGNIIAYRLITPEGTAGKFMIVQ